MSTRISHRARRGVLLTAVALLAPVAAVAGTAVTAAPGGAALPACTTTWTNTAGGTWDTAASWSGGSVPTSSDHVCITTPGTYAVALADIGNPGAQVHVASLTIGTASGADTQTLVVSRGVSESGASSLYADQGIDIRARGSLALGQSDAAEVSIGVGATATIANAGHLGQVAGQTDVHTIRGDVANTGTFRLQHPIFVEGDVTTEGLLQVDHVLHVEGVMWTKAGTISGEWAVDAHGGLRVGDTVIGTPGVRPVFGLDGGVLAFESDQPIDVTVYDQVALEGDTASRQDVSVQTQDGRDTVLTFTGTWTSRGAIDLQPGAEADVAIVGVGAGATLVSEEHLERFTEHDTASTVDAHLVNRGVVDTGDGTIAVTGDLENEGSVDLGLGRLDVGGDLTLEPGGVVRRDVDGVDGGRLVADGALGLDGVLEVSTTTAPAVGSSAMVALGAIRTGTFDDVVFSGPASYDAVYTGLGVNLVRRASEPATRRFVRAAFQDFLGRQPDHKELSNIAGVIDSGNGTRASLVRSLSTSPEYVAALVQRYYGETLGRPGTGAEVAYWVGEIRSGRRTVVQVAGSFYASGEYYGRAGGTDAAWVGDLYGVFFDRPPTSGDLTYWTGRIAARGRGRVAVELFQSLESRRQRVQRLYDELLGREGDADGVDYWAGRITSTGDLALAVNLASSGEYLARAQVRYP